MRFLERLFTKEVYKEQYNIGVYSKKSGAQRWLKLTGKNT